MKFMITVLLFVSSALFAAEVENKDGDTYSTIWLKKYFKNRFVNEVKFSFMFYKIGESRVTLITEPVLRNKIPRIKFYDNPTLSGKPVVEIKDDGLYRKNEKVCSIYKEKHTIPKEVLEGYKNKKDFINEFFFSTAITKNLNYYVDTSKNIVNHGVQIPFCEAFYKNGYPFNKKIIEPLPSITISDAQESFAPGEYVYLIYADEYTDGIAKMTEYISGCTTCGFKAKKLDKPYYFRPSDYGLFLVVSPYD